MILSHFHMVIHSHDRTKANTVQSVVNQLCRCLVSETRELSLQSKLANVLFVWEIKRTTALEHDLVITIDSSLWKFLDVTLTQMPVSELHLL